MATEILRSAGTTDFGAVTAAIGRAVAAIASGARAGSDWRRLNALADAELARQGLSRDGIARAVFDRNFA